MTSTAAFLSMPPPIEVNLKQEPFFFGGVCPEYYKIRLLDGYVITPFDVIEARSLNFNVGCVVKYVLRAGLKTKTPIDDLKKARNCLDREIRRLETSAEPRSTARVDPFVSER